MKVKEILGVIDTAYPFAAAEDWDHSGLLVGDPEAEVTKVFVAVDATDEIIEEARERGAQLLFTHHPLLFHPLSAVVADDFIGRRVLSLAKNDMSYIAAHTNYDVIRMGRLAAERLSVAVEGPLEASFGPEGLGFVGTLSAPVSLADFAKQLREAFGLPSVEVYGDPEKTVERVAMLPGSGRHEYTLGLAQNADVYVTGDMDHHSGIDAAAQGMAVIDAGHYGVEQIFVADAAAYLRKHCPGVEVMEEECRLPQWVSG